MRSISRLLRPGTSSNTRPTKNEASTRLESQSTRKVLKVAEIKKTSDMMYPLEAPNGWFLKVAQHEHEKNGESHYLPVQNASGSWHVEFRRNVTSNDKANVAFGRGQTMEHAWARAKEVAERFS
jgi:hypothetical protein